MEQTIGKEYVSIQELRKDNYNNLVIKAGESIKIPIGEMNGAFRIGRNPNSESFKKENFVDCPSFSLKDEEGNNISKLQRVGLLIQPIDTGGMYVKNETKNETREIILNGDRVRINPGESVFVDERDNAPGFDYDLGDGKHIAHIERGPLSNSVELSVTSNRNGLRDIQHQEIERPSPKSAIELSRLNNKKGGVKEMPDEQWVAIPENLQGGGIAIGTNLNLDQNHTLTAGAMLDIDGKANSPIGIYFDTTKGGFLITNPTNEQMAIWADGVSVKIDPKRSPTRINAKLVTFSYAGKYLFIKKEGDRTLLKSVVIENKTDIPRIVNSPIKDEARPANQGIDTRLEDDRAIPGFIVLDGELYTKDGDMIEVNGKKTTYDEGNPTRVKPGDVIKGSDGNLYIIGVKKNRRTENERWVFRPYKG